FSEKGFSATTMRDIAKLAAAELSSMSYHFKSKEEIFDLVIERRAKDAIDALTNALHGAVNDQGFTSTEGILSAFIETAVRPISLKDPGWTHYVRLIMQQIGTDSDKDGYSHPAIRRRYLPVRRRFIAALSATMPDVPVKE